MNIKELSGTLTIGLDELHALSAALTGTGAAVALTGGAVRDQLHGIVPSDLDYAILGADIDAIEQAHQALDELGYGLRAWFDRDADNSYAESFPGSEDRFSEIRKYEHPETGDKLDLLVYTPAFRSIAEAVASHDHTISQFAAEIAHDEIRISYLGVSPLGECRLVRPGVGAQRVERIRAVCDLIGWRYAE